MSVERDHAVVVGASVAGLATARALSDRFAQVTIVERDPLTDDAQLRRGVPQTHHVHALLPAGAMALDDLYGDFSDVLRARGCAVLDAVEQQLSLLADGWARRAPSGVMLLCATRWTIERTVRDLTLRTENVSVHRGQVTGLRATADRTRVTGVDVRNEDGSETTIDGDLVVDASGRGTRTPKWLEDMGYAPVAQSIVRPFLGYATVHCTIDEDAWPGDLRLFDAVPQPPLHPRGGVAMAEENGTIVICAVGAAGDYPPGDADGFAEFLRTGISPVIYEMWRRSTPITEIRTSKTSVNRLNHWHELERRPAGFIAVGDAAVALNPVYGQGMTVASMEARHLRDRLREADELDDVVDRFPGEAFAVAEFAWGLATGGDMAWPTTETENMPAAGADDDAHYQRMLQRLAVDDADVVAAMFRAVGFMRPELLDTPQLRERVARAGDLALGLPQNLSLPPDVAEAFAANEPAARP